MAEDALAMYEILFMLHPVEENPSIELDARRQWHDQVEALLGAYLVRTTPPSLATAPIDIDVDQASTITETDAESLYHRDTDSSSPAPSTPRRSASTSSICLPSHAPRVILMRMARIGIHRATYFDSDGLHMIQKQSASRLQRWKRIRGFMKTCNYCL
jgi:hypothetical protein